MTAAAPAKPTASHNATINQVGTARKTLSMAVSVSSGSQIGMRKYKNDMSLPRSSLPRTSRARRSISMLLAPSLKCSKLETCSWLSSCTTSS